MDLKTLLTTDPYDVGLAGPIAAGNAVLLASLVNDRTKGGQTLSQPVVPVTAQMLPLIAQAELPTIFNSGLAQPLSTALQIGDVTQLATLATAFAAANWITGAELTAVMTYLTTPINAPASSAEKAGIVPYGGSVTVAQVQAALGAQS